LQVYETEVRAVGEPSVLTSGTTLLRPADGRTLGLRVVESANPVQSGDKLTYTLYYSNRGASTLNQVSLDLVVPEGAELDAGSTNSWSLGALGPGEGGTRQATVMVNAATGQQLRASAVVGDPTDPALDTRATIQTPIAESALIAAVEVNPDPAERGEQSNVAITVTNRSASQTVNSAFVEARIPRGTTAIAQARTSSGAACTYPSWTYCDAGENVTWDLGDLAPRESRVVSFEPIIDSAAKIGALQPYEVEIRSHQEPPVVAGAVALLEAADTRVLGLRLVEDANPAETGQLLTYTLHYANQSDVTINDVRLALAIPEGTVLDAGSMDTWSVGPLSPGQSDTRQATVLVNADQGDQLHAAAIVYDNADPVIEARATSNTPVDLSTVRATLSVDTVTAQRGEQIRVSLQVSNPSPSTPQNQVRVEAQLPQNISAITSNRASPGAACTYPSWTYCDAGETVYWTIDTLAPQESTGTDLWFDPIIANGGNDGDILFFEAQTTVGGVPRAVAGATVAVDGP
jgi:uncharacterized repeat protein (TIGR01451 family)